MTFFKNCEVNDVLYMRGWELAKRSFDEDKEIKAIDHLNIHNFYVVNGIRDSCMEQSKVAVFSDRVIDNVIESMINFNFFQHEKPKRRLIDIQDRTEYCKSYAKIYVKITSHGSYQWAFDYAWNINKPYLAYGYIDGAKHATKLNRALAKTLERYLNSTLPPQFISMIDDEKKRLSDEGNKKHKDKQDQSFA